MQFGRTQEGNMSSVASKLADAWKAVQAAEIPEHLHEIAFHEALLIADPRPEDSPGDSSSHPADPQTEKPQGASRGAPKSAKGTAQKSRPSKVETVLFDGDEDTFFKRFSDESGVEEEELRRVYVFANGTWRISLSKSKLGTSEAERNRSVGLLLAASRFYVNGTVATPISDIREAASRIPYEVSRNFGTHMERVDGTVPGGSGRDKTIRAQTGKIDDSFKTILRRVLGQSNE
jgi:hypothetical protein